MQELNLLNMLTIGWLCMSSLLTMAGGLEDSESQCLSNGVICKNHGICEVHKMRDGTVIDLCRCQRHFSGRDCGYANSACSTVNCRYNSYCDINGCTCAEPGLYTGEDCSEVHCIDGEITENFCKNGGLCINGQCICPNNTRGDHCELTDCGYCYLGRCECDIPCAIGCDISTGLCKDEPDESPTETGLSNTMKIVMIVVAAVLAIVILPAFYAMYNMRIESQEYNKQMMSKMELERMALQRQISAMSASKGDEEDETSHTKSEKKKKRKHSKESDRESADETESRKTKHKKSKRKGSTIQSYGDEQSENEADRYALSTQTDQSTDEFDVKGNKKRKKSRRKWEERRALSDDDMKSTADIHVDSISARSERRKSKKSIKPDFVQPDQLMADDTESRHKDSRRKSYKSEERKVSAKDNPDDLTDELQDKMNNKRDMDETTIDVIANRNEKPPSSSKENKKSSRKQRSRSPDKPKKQKKAKNKEKKKQKKKNKTKEAN